MTDIYHLPKSNHPSWHRKRRSNDPRVDDEVSFQSSCNDMAISFPGLNSTARPGLDNDQTALPPGRPVSSNARPMPAPPPPSPWLYTDTCIKMEHLVKVPQLVSNKLLKGTTHQGSQVFHWSQCRWRIWLEIHNW